MRIFKGQPGSTTPAASRVAGVLMLLAVTGCGYKGPLYMPPPPPPPADTLTLPPTPGNAPTAAPANQTSGPAAQPVISIDNIRGK